MDNDLTVIDIDDYIPKRFTLRFSISGRKYVADFSEATVDEVLRMMRNEKSEDEVIDQVRRIVLCFLCNHLVEGEKEQLRIDLQTVPYASAREGLDILSLNDAIQQRFSLKKGLGAVSPTGSRKGPYGWFGRLLGL